MSPDSYVRVLFQSLFYYRVQPTYIHDGISVMYNCVIFSELSLDLYRATNMKYPMKICRRIACKMCFLNTLEILNTMKYWSKFLKCNYFNNSLDTVYLVFIYFYMAYSFLCVNIALTIFKFIKVVFLGMFALI